MQRWPETKRLLGLLVNSSGRAHGRNARRLVHAARKQDRRLAVALLAAAVSHTPEGEEVLRGARMRMARKPSAVARELLRNFPKGGKRRRKRSKRGNGNERGEGRTARRPAERGGRVEAEEARSPRLTPERRRRDENRDGPESARSEAPRATSGASPTASEHERRRRRRRGRRCRASAELETTPANAEPRKGERRRRRPTRQVESANAKAKPKAAKAAPRTSGSEAGQVDLAGAEGDAVAVGDRTTRLPRSSMPSATPAPPPRRSRGRAARRGRARPARTCCGLGLDPVVEAALRTPAALCGRPIPGSSSGETAGAPSPGGRAEDRDRRHAEVGRELVGSDREVRGRRRSRPSRPGAAPRSGLPASLRSSSQTSLGHLTWHSMSGRSASAASQTASGTASGSSRWRSSSGRRIAE